MKDMCCAKTFLNECRFEVMRRNMPVDIGGIQLKDFIDLLNQDNRINKI